MHLIDVLVTQHAKWKAKRIRRGLFGQALVDFSTASWSSIQLKDCGNCNASQHKRDQPKKTPRILRSFAQSRVVVDEDVDMSAGTADVSRKKFSEQSDAGSVASGSEESNQNLG